MKSSTETEVHTHNVETCHFSGQRSLPGILFVCQPVHTPEMGKITN